MVTQPMLSTPGASWYHWSCGVYSPRQHEVPPSECLLDLITATLYSSHRPIDLLVGMSKYAHITSPKHILTIIPCTGGSESAESSSDSGAPIAAGSSLVRSLSCAMAARMPEPHPAAAAASAAAPASLTSLHPPPCPYPTP